MRFDSLREFLDTLPGLGLPGFDCSLSIDGVEVFRHSGGYADCEASKPIAPDTIYHLYSCSKLLTCVTALHLFEQGQFLLTDYVDTYLPEFKHMMVRHPRVDGGFDLRPACNRIRIQDLFSMTSGLDYDRNTPAFREALHASPSLTTRSVAGAIAAKPLLFEPGTHWTYGLSHDVLGGLICELTGLSLEQAIHKSICEPLEMTDTTFFLTPEQKARMAVQYRFDDNIGRAVRWDVPSEDQYSDLYESGGSGLYSTVNDYAAFLRGLATGHVLSRRTIDLMRSNLLTPAMTNDLDWVQMRGYGYGLGCRTMIDPAHGGSLSPVGEFGWGGLAGAYAMIDPTNRLSIAYFQHMINSMEPYIHPRIRNIAYACLD